MYFACGAEPGTGEFHEAPRRHQPRETEGRGDRADPGRLIAVTVDIVGVVSRTVEADGDLLEGERTRVRQRRCRPRSCGYRRSSQGCRGWMVVPPWSGSWPRDLDELGAAGRIGDRTVTVFPCRRGLGDRTLDEVMPQRRRSEMTGWESTTVSVVHLVW